MKYKLVHAIAFIQCDFYCFRGIEQLLLRKKVNVKSTNSSCVAHPKQVSNFPFWVKTDVRIFDVIRPVQPRLVFVLACFYIGIKTL